MDREKEQSEGIKKKPFYCIKKRNLKQNGGINMSKAGYEVVLAKQKSEINYLELKKEKVSCDVLGQVFDDIEEETEPDETLRNNKKMRSK